MSPSVQGALVLVTTVGVLMTGAPVAFALGAVGLGFLVLFQGTRLAESCGGNALFGPE